MPYISKESSSVSQPFRVVLNERVLDTLLGGIAWISLVGCIVLALLYPQTLLFFATLLALYSSIRFVAATIFNEMGLRKIRVWEQTNWYEHYHQERDPTSLAWKDAKHVVLIPNYDEPIEILRHSLEHLANQYEARTRLIIVLAMEAGENRAEEKANTLRKEYASHFLEFLITFHPSHLQGEIPGKSANIAWAAREAKKYLIDTLHYNPNHVLVTTMDADTRWHPQHFEALTYCFAVAPDRYHNIWQAPIRYHLNFGKINPMFRLLNACANGFEMAYLASPFWVKVPISSYALSFKLLIDSQYWDADVVSDEYHMLVKAYFVGKGQVQVKPVFLPFLASSPAEPRWLDTARIRYRQTVRHAFASKETGYLIAKMLEQPHCVKYHTYRLLFRLAHDVLLAGAGWVIITVGIQLPFLLQAEIASPVFIALVLSGVMVFLSSIVFFYQDFIVRPFKSDTLSWHQRLLTVLAFPLLPVLTLIFVAVPTLHSQTLLLLGLPLHFKVTRKRSL